jgi:hypothetical protein
MFYVSVGIYIRIACMFGNCIMGYEYVIYSIDVFRLVHMKCMPAIL